MGDGDFVDYFDSDDDDGDDDDDDDGDYDRKVPFVFSPLTP